MLCTQLIRPLCGLLFVLQLGCGPAVDSSSVDRQLPTSPSASPFDQMGPVCGIGVEAERDGNEDPLAGFAAPAAAVGGEFGSIAPRERFRRCAGATIAETTLATVELGRRASGGWSEQVQAADEVWLSTAPWLALKLILQLGDGAAPLVVDQWELVRSLPPQRQGPAAVLASLASKEADHRARMLAVLGGLPEDSFSLLLDRPELAALMTTARAEDVGPCIDVVQAYGDEGVVMIAALEGLGELGQCAAVDEQSIGWLGEAEASLESMEVRLKQLGRIQAVRAALAERSLWGADLADQVMRRLAHEHELSGKLVSGSWTMAIQDAEWTHPGVLALAPASVASRSGSVSAGAELLWASLTEDMADASADVGTIRAAVAGPIAAGGPGPVADAGPEYWETPQGVWSRKLLLLDSTVSSLQPRDREPLLRAFEAWPESVTKSIERSLDWERPQLLADVAASARELRMPEVWVVPSATSSFEQAQRLRRRLVAGSLSRSGFEVSDDPEIRGAWSYVGEEAFIETIKEVFGIELFQNLYLVLAALAEGSAPSKRLLTQVGIELVVGVVLSVTGLAVARGVGKGLLEKLFSRGLNKLADLLDGGGNSKLRAAAIALFKGARWAAPRGLAGALKFAGKHWDSVATRYGRTHRNSIGRVLIDNSRLITRAAHAGVDGVRTGPVSAGVRLVVKPPRVGSIVPGRIHRHLGNSATSPALSYITRRGLTGGSDVVRGAGLLFERLPQSWQNKVGAWTLRRMEPSISKQGADAAHKSMLVFTAQVADGQLEAAQPQ